MIQARKLEEIKGATEKIREEVVLKAHLGKAEEIKTGFEGIRNLF